VTEKMKKTETNNIGEPKPMGVFKRYLYAFGKFVLRLLFRVEVRGLEHYHAAGDKVLILPNHGSLLDPALITLFLPKAPFFVISPRVANWWWVRLFLRLERTWPIDQTNFMAMKGLITELRQGGHCVVFPEGRISTTGGVMKVHDGVGLVAEKTGAMLLPLRIDGTQFLKGSYLDGKYPTRWFPKITLTFLPPRPIDVPAEARGHKRRELMRLFLEDLLREAACRAMGHRKALFQAVLDARDTYGRKRIIAMDITRGSINYDQLVITSLILGDLFAPMTKKGENVGVLLPSSITTVGMILGLSLRGRVAAMLNFSAGAKNVLACAAATQVKTVATSRRFVEAGKFESLIEALQEGGLNVIWLEDLAKAKVNIFTKIGALIRARFMRASSAKGDPDAPALILFTSGSEGTPKGVALSSANIVANRNNLISAIDFCPKDVVMNAMPMFHVFGSAIGTMMPLLTGMKTFYYPTPLHYNIIPSIAYEIDATVMLGTDTFLYGFARNAHPFDFYKVRYVAASGERLRDRTKKLWNDKFGIRLLEGYGSTEASVIAANTALNFNTETMGRLLPGVSSRIDPVPGIKEGGRCYIKGTNVMLGYIKADNPGVIQPPEDGWYDTGDIVHVDDYGFMTIKGRARRFAKIGGEMVSLTALEEETERLWPGIRHAILAVQDERKGEQLLIVTEKQDADRDELFTYMKGRGYAEFSIPKKIFPVPAIPLLGSGKTNYPELTRQVEEQ